MDEGRKVMARHFITVEGGEGAGKTTVLLQLQEKLTAVGYDVLITREPGGIPIAEEIRELILHPENTAMDMRTEALLYAAARRQHLVEKVMPALEAGQIVLCDRFIDSSLAYQGHARGIGMEEVYEMNRFAIDTLMPALTLFFDIEPAAGLKRINQNKGREINRLDLEEEAFHDKVYEGYHILCERFRDRIKIVDARPEVEKVTEEAFQLIKSHLAEGG